MLQNVWKWWQSDVYVVPTSSTTYVAGEEGTIFRVPSRVLVELPTYRIIAYGDEAREVEHAGFGESAVVHPYTALSITDEVGATVLLRSLFRLVLGSRFLLKPHVVVSLTDKSTPFMQEIWQHVIYAAGARQVSFVHPLLAVGAGAGLPVYDAHGYSVGIVDENGLSFGLIAFGHVQYQTFFAWSSIPDDDTLLLEIFQLQWQKFLQILPVEFLRSISSEGCVLSWDECPADAPVFLSQQLETPIVLVPRSVEVLGLRAFREGAW